MSTQTPGSSLKATAPRLGDPSRYVTDSSQAAVVLHGARPLQGERDRKHPASAQPALPAACALGKLSWPNVSQQSDCACLLAVGTVNALTASLSCAGTVARARRTGLPEGCVSVLVSSWHLDIMFASCAARGAERWPVDSVDVHTRCHINAWAACLRTWRCRAQSSAQS